MADIVLWRVDLIKMCQAKKNRALWHCLQSNQLHIQRQCCLDCRILQHKPLPSLIRQLEACCLIRQPAKSLLCACLTRQSCILGWVLIRQQSKGQDDWIVEALLKGAPHLCCTPQILQ